MKLLQVVFKLLHALQREFGIGCFDSDLNQD